MARDGTVVVAIESQTAGVGDPVEAALLGLPVEIDFGETAAVVVAGAEEEDSLWVGDRVVLHRQRLSRLFATEVTEDTETY